ncbi:MAG: antitoxin family protein [Planctomycetes bacterium]|nr:antitoxin family protein [Planctomycetota bacterium]
MSLQVEAIYENGVLKLDQPLPLQDQERVVLTVQPKVSHAKQSYGLLRWTGSVEELDELLAADNHPWATQE